VRSLPGAPGGRLVSSDVNWWPPPQGRVSCRSPCNEPPRLASGVVAVQPPDPRAARPKPVIRRPHGLPTPSFRANCSTPPPRGTDLRRRVLRPVHAVALFTSVTFFTWRRRRSSQHGCDVAASFRVYPRRVRLYASWRPTLSPLLTCHRASIASAWRWRRRRVDAAVAVAAGDYGRPRARRETALIAQRRRAATSSPSPARFVRSLFAVVRDLLLCREAWARCCPAGAVESRRPGPLRRTRRCHPGGPRAKSSFTRVVGRAGDDYVVLTGCEGLDGGDGETVTMGQGTDRILPR